MAMEGWKWLANATKWHYFRDGRSVCGKWMNLGSGEFQQGNNDSPDNCKGCMNALAGKPKEKAHTPVQVTLRFSNAVTTHEKTVSGYVTPERIMAYGRTFIRKTGAAAKRGTGATFVRIISYQVEGQPTVLFDS